MVTIRPPKTIVKPTALGPVANTDTKLLIYGLFQKGRVLAQDDVHITNSKQRKHLTGRGGSWKAGRPALLEGERVSQQETGDFTVEKVFMLARPSGSPGAISSHLPTMRKTMSSGFR